MHGVEFGAFQLFAQERRLVRQGAMVPLGGRALDLLILLVENAGNVVTKPQLMERAWPDITVEESSLRGHIAAIRKALDEGKDGVRYIANVAGRGYCFVHHVGKITPPNQTAQKTPVRGPAGSLPAIPTRMIGRDNDMRAIGELLSARRFVTIHGPGGIGKTTVAVATGHHHSGLFQHGTQFLDLGVHHAQEAIPEVLASKLGLAVPTNDPTAAVISYLRDRQMLLIFDCCEHVIGSAATLAETIFQEIPGVSILATSREPLRVAGEHVYPLVPMDIPPEGAKLNASTVLNYSAASLFLERVVAGGHPGGLNDADAIVVANICRKVDGIALALELAAGRVSTHGLRGTAELLDGRLKLLWQGRRTALPRHQTLSATLDWSYELLSECERIVLRRLSVFVGPFGLAEAQAIAGDDIIAAADIVEALAHLVSKSLVVANTVDGVRRYRLLDTTRAYAKAKLADADEEAAVSLRHAFYYVEPLRLIATTTRISLDRNAVAILHLGNIRAALDWSLSEAGDAALGVRLAADSVRLFLRDGLLAECRRWCERALAVLPDELRDTRYDMALYAALGHVQMYCEGNSVKARALHEQALRIAEILQDYDAQFRLLGCLHIYDRRTGDFTRLLDIAEKAAALTDRLAEPAVSPAADVLFAASHYLAGNLAKARECLIRVLQRPENATHGATNFLDFRSEAQLLLARVLWLQGFADQALNLVREGESAARPDPLAACQVLVLAGGLFHFRGDWPTFESYVDRLIQHATEYSLKPYRSVGYGLKGEALFRQGDRDASLRLIREALTELKAENFGTYTPWLSCTLAEGLALNGFLDQALGLMDDVISAAWRSNGLYIIPELLRVHGELFVMAGSERDAERMFEQSISIADVQTALSWRLRSVTSLARLRARQQRRREGWAILSETYALFSEGFDTADLRAAKRLLDALGTAAT